MKVSPIQAEHLPAIGQFLHDNLNRRFTPEGWIGSLTHRWAASLPNLGMQLHDGDRLVGVFGAIYSDQWINGRLESFCNPFSWCVLETHRRHGIGLVLALIKQPGYHFTMFTPNPTVTKVFLGLKFTLLDDRQTRCINLPSVQGWRRGAFVETDHDRILARLRGHSRQDFEAHRSIAWLNFVAFGVADDCCWVIYKPYRWKRMPSAQLMHISDATAFDRHQGLLRQHLLVTRRMTTFSVESRWLRRAPAWSIGETRTQPKLLKSPTLAHSEVKDLYSELMSLDI